jgi:hypothetical protein
MSWGIEVPEFSGRSWDRVEVAEGKRAQKERDKKKGSPQRNWIPCHPYVFLTTPGGGWQQWLLGVSIS